MPLFHDERPMTPSEIAGYGAFDTNNAFAHFEQTGLRLDQAFFSVVRAGDPVDVSLYDTLRPWQR